MPAPPPPGKKKKSSAPAPTDWRTLLWYLPFALLLLWLWQDVFNAITVHTIPYSQFKAALAAGEVKEAQIKETEIVGLITPRPAEPEAEKPAAESPPTEAPAPETPAEPEGATPKATTPEAAPAVEKKPPMPELIAPVDVPSEPFLFRTVRVEDADLAEQLQAAGVAYEGVRPGLMSQLFISWILPLSILALIWMLLARRMGAAGQVMNVGKSRARLVSDKETGVTFVDVAGCEEAKFELQEVVDFLKNPDRYSALGAKIPKGVLLVGPPGTGKTLLARAVAGEADVPFFQLSGSDFVEMFVGVGAARVRDLFEQAKQQAPCIIFIDELDAIGRERGVRVGAVNDEREQTLNQLLVEMDGFEANVGVILLAATNRPEVLDRALLRPGRFDRQVIVDAPDLDGRIEILKVHSRDKPLDAQVDLRKIAQGTPGFSGADLANAMNEAALLAARRGGQVIKQHDMEEAVEKVVAGPERKSRRLGDEEKRRVAYHEVGHALVGALSKGADPVHKISIVPRGRAALGYTLQLPTGEQFLLTRSELFDRIKGLLGGRAAEEVIYGEVSTGAENDLERATALARQMVCSFGMSESIGLVHCGRRTAAFLPGQELDVERDCSERTASQIDAEVKQLLDSAYGEARAILLDHREQLDTIAAELLKREVIDAATFNHLLGTPESTPIGVEGTV